MPEEIKKEPEDIFAEETLSSPIKTTAPSQIPKEFFSTTQKKPKGLSKSLIIIAAVFLVFLISWLVYSFFTQRTKEKITTQFKNFGLGLISNQFIPLDTDRDGLTDEKEKELGLDINSPDTDDDGLFDREEIEIYKTDPLNPDSDNDGLKDGDEVKTGLHPLDSTPGAKIFDLKTEIEKLGQ